MIQVSEPFSVNTEEQLLTTVLSLLRPPEPKLVYTYRRYRSHGDIIWKYDEYFAASGVFTELLLKALRNPSRSISWMIDQHPVHREET